MNVPGFTFSEKKVFHIPCSMGVSASDDRDISRSGEEHILRYNLKRIISDLGRIDSYNRILDG